MARVSAVPRITFKIGYGLIPAWLSKLMKNKKALNLTIHQRVLDMANEVADALGYSSISTLVEHLIREEYQKRTRPISIPENSKAERLATDIERSEKDEVLSSQDFPSETSFGSISQKSEFGLRGAQGAEPAQAHPSDPNRPISTARKSSGRKRRTPVRSKANP